MTRTKIFLFAAASLLFLMPVQAQAGPIEERLPRTSIAALLHLPRALPVPAPRAVEVEPQPEQPSALEQLTPSAPSVQLWAAALRAFGRR